MGTNLTNHAALLQAAVDHVGSAGKLAELLGVGPSVVSNWKMRKSIPPQYCAQIEALTGGKVSRKKLYPNDWRRIWPELAEKVAA